MAMLDHVDAIKTIPGYKIILTAVIKGQIKQLVEQLSHHSDEECVLLTANVSDGTMTDMGSESGKGFLQGHEDIKSQFLQFCFNDSHMKQITNSTRKSSSPSATSFNSQNKMDTNKGLKSNPLKAGSVMRTRTSSGSRPKPYMSMRSRKKLATNPGTSECATVTTDDGCVIKNDVMETLSSQANDGTTVTEADLNEADFEITENSSSSLNAFYLKLASQSSDVQDFPTFQPNRDSGLNNVDNMELPSIPIDLSEVAKSMSTESRSQLCNDITNNILDGGADLVEVKQEPILQHYGSDTVSSPAGAKPVTPMKVYACDLCGKPFPSKWELGRHRRTHTGEKPYNCQFCSKAFGDKSNMTQHVKSVHLREPIRKKVPIDNCSDVKYLV